MTLKVAKHFDTFKKFLKFLKCGNLLILKNLDLRNLQDFLNLNSTFQCRYQTEGGILTTYALGFAT